MKSVLAIAGILALASCSSAEDFFTENLGDNNKSVKMTFTASQENGSATRTAIGTEGGETKIHWSESDVIKVTNGTETNDFTLTAGQGTTKATFNGEISESATYYAIYPNQSDVTFSNNTFSGVELKAEQEAVEGSFDPKAAIMVAKSNGTNLPFKNVVAYFKVTPTFDCSEIVVTAHKSTDALAGKFDVAIDGEGTPSISNITNKSREVKLTGTITANKDYYILLLPGTFEYGFSVTLKPKDDTSKKYFKQRNTSYTLNRNDLCNLGTMADATLVDFYDNTTIPYITFKAGAEQTFSYYDLETQYNKDANEYLEISLGSDQVWVDFKEVNEVTFGGDYGDLRLRAKGGDGIFFPAEEDDGNEYLPFMFKFEKPDVSVKCEGDIRTLIDYENYYCANTSKATFKGFFSKMTNLTSAPDLPNMELASGCYQQMFYGCTGLTTAPALPATTLANYCYESMFFGCTGLTTAPALPATTLAIYCYYNMFYGCTGLTTAPALSATTLANYCYSFMFYGCSKLSNVTMLATNYTATNCLNYWLNNAGTSAGSRKLTLASEEVYNGIKVRGNNWLPMQWKQDYEGTEVSW